ncbi:tetratricopeptide repeat protein [Flavobacterium stagni]|uniref:Tetratricopeptide repeat protein n=1 Tax=Flavobacterium stagni TaxID=2506421 RepID=A0A4Q1KCV4_9FLAO|nr:tetratricopeptide repeat protein [Flavobacterium stagni]RXR24486.1 tetratricopeptide repeat protein [Flavobacterium stagni]
MKRFLLFIVFGLSLTAFAQNEQLAQNYFDRGEFEKALVSYEELLKSQPHNFNYFQRTVECYQQLQQFDKAEKLILERLEMYKQGSFLVELGYNFQLQKNTEKAKKYYEQALDKIRKNHNEVFQIAYAFDKKSLTDYAIQSYELALTLEPKYNFNYQLALLYGQKGDLDTMIEKFLTESYSNPQSLVMVQNQLSRFMNEEANVTFNDALRKALLGRIQKTQDLFWNDYLSWFYVQQKEYSKAFIQQKAIYKRSPESFSNIVNLAQLAMTEGDQEAAQEILQFILDNTKDLDLQIKAHTYLIELRIKKAQPADYPAIAQELDLRIKQFGVSPYSLSLLQLKAKFAAFQQKDTETAKFILKNALEMPLKREEIAEVKMDLADILLLEEKFNQALIYYAQVENEGGNSPTGQEASLRVAKTSYYKADFKWAEHQLNVLKSASTQLIANDAMDLYLLISDNTVADSTQTALKKFARADYLLYQNKKAEALQAFQTILKEHKGQEIEPITLLRIGKLEEEQNNIPQAIASYRQIIDQHKECIYVDEATYFAAELYNKTGDAEKAKPLYEDLILNHEDSIYYVDAQKKFRRLRGDKEL